MRATEFRVVVMATALVVALATPGCSPGSGGSGSPQSDPADTLELECEQGLEALDTAIARSETDTRVSAAALHEARALRTAAGELYLEAEFELALELIDEALALLGGTG